MNTSQISETPSDDIVDVAIVGYGPVGAALAILLGQRGHRVVVLDRHRQPYPLPRAVHATTVREAALHPPSVRCRRPMRSDPRRARRDLRVPECPTGERCFGSVAAATVLSGWPQSSMS